ncbi:15-O-acetyltransferase [Dothidotthia symphoricarpi CBS 119687]|uniref:15-O-acetyltransferase n=1 Tax=Dothidotthia symphoricarpi CBS 119687 TaxID=1392245 RepID=A0A6A6A1B6_9PLEO|nr:15-O-acetyltransferase [Dothidotthia symphoricarpi CBS 119687]KAF2125620.1 15-O-acetyltransferase [Dothidotthia symphoricarpi CBS 119687]
MTSDQFPKLMPATYRWQTSKTNSRTIERRAIGTEAWVGIKDENYKGQYDLFLNTTLRVQVESTKTPLSLASLKKAVTTVLVELRFEHPESAGTAVWDDQGPLLQYTPPESAEDALSWAEAAIELWFTVKTGFEVRKEIGRRRKEPGSVFSGHAKSLTVHLVADVPSEHAPLVPGATVDVLMHMNHIFWDGISARMFVGSLLRKLQTELSDNQKPKQLDWGRETKNISQPILDAAKVDVTSLGKDFEDAREEFLQSLMAFANSWAMDLKVDVGAPSTEFRTFTAAESRAIIQAVKARLGPGYTISHLGQAATALALLKANPIPEDVSGIPSIIMPLPVNGRRFLKDEYVQGQYGACQAGAVVQFRDARSFLVDDDEKSAVISMLAKGCRISKEQYDYWLSKPFQMAVNISKDNFLASFLSANPQEASSKAVPVFISDGVNDRFIPGNIIDSTTNKTIMTVDNVAFFTDSYMPGLLVRMESWKGVTSIGLSYNDGTFTAEQAVTLLKYIMGYMLVFTQ